MPTNPPAKAHASWHPCDNGLIPIAEALERCSKASVLDLPRRIMYQSTSPSYMLCRAVNEQTTPGHVTAPPRVEMLRRWLQTNGFAADAKELKSRWTTIFRRFQRWEQLARQHVAPPESNAMFCSETICDAYDRVIDLVDDLADWCRQLAWMLRPRLRPTQKPSAIVAQSKPLTEAQQGAYDLICTEGPLTAKAIVRRLGLSSESLFTGKYVPELKRHGILNRRGLGYYHPDFYSPGPVG